jgi:hypothetical protein
MFERQKGFSMENLIFSKAVKLFLGLTGLKGLFKLG